MFLPEAANLSEVPTWEVVSVPSPNRTHRGVAFDCDGVLVDSETLSARVLLQMLQACGVDGLGHIDLLQLIAGVRVASWVSTLRSRYGTVLISDDFESCYRALVANAYSRRLRSIVDVEKAVHAAPLAQRIVVSNAPIWKINSGLELTELSHLFDHNPVSAYDLQQWKPDPGPYLAAARRLECRPSELIAVEDSLAGVTSAVAAGTTVIHYGTYMSPDMDTARSMSHYSVGSHLDTAKIIERLVARNVPSESIHG